jgi:hypothetical protein
VLFDIGTLESTMSILSVLTFPSVSASRHAHAMAFVGRQPAAIARATTRFELIKVVVTSKDAWQARKALAACPETAVVRCLPKHNEDKVALEIRFPAGQSGDVIRNILGSVPVGEIGCIIGYAPLTAFDLCGHKDRDEH